MGPPVPRKSPDRQGEMERGTSLEEHPLRRLHAGIRAFGLLAGLSLLTHLPGIFNRLLDFQSWAQTLRASQARNYFEGDMNFFHPRYYFAETSGHERALQFPLNSYCAALLYKTFGFHDWLGRLLSA